MIELQLRNSFCTLLNLPDAVREQLLQLLTYKDESVESQKGQLFYNLKRAKYSGNKAEEKKILGKIKWLDSKEWVCLLENDTFPSGLLNMVRDLLDTLQAPYELVDFRQRPQADEIYRLKKPLYEMYYYQKDMVEAGIKEGRGVIESAVGTGKSEVIKNLIYELSTTALIVVPSRGLVDQLYNDIEEFFGSKYVEVVDSKKVRAGKKMKPIRIVTPQTLASLQDTGDLQNLIHDINSIYLDEFHHAGSDTYTNLLPELEHIYYRFGLTGTFTRNDSKILELWGFMSNVLYTYPAWKAIDEGFLTPLEVNVYDLRGKKHRNYQKEYDYNYCKTQNSTSELLFKIEDIILNAGFEEQILILVNKKDKAGKIIHDFLTTMGIENSYISGDDKKEVISSTIVAFNEKRIRVLIGSSVIGEGINVKATDHLIMAQGGKSEIAITQATGRAVRLFPGKIIARIHDFKFEGTNFLEKHLDERLFIYKQNFAAQIKFVS